MTVDQLDLLLNYSTFGDIAGDRFASGTDEEAARDEHDRDYELRNDVDSKANDIRDEMARVIDWAKGTVGPSEYTDTTAKPLPVQKPKREYTDTTAKSVPTQFNPNNTDAGPINLPKRKPGKGKR